MDNSNEYQANAAYCQHMAEAASREDDKQQWSTLAQHWLRLGRPLRGTETEISNGDGRDEADRPKKTL
jgi:hypothetical protein